jgi:hypothetical protein
VSRAICCVRDIRKGEEIVVNYDLDAEHPMYYLDRMIRSKYKDKKWKSCDHEEEGIGVFLNVDFGEGVKRKCRTGQCLYLAYQ